MKKDIKAVQPLWDWMNARQKIWHLRNVVHASPPWTDDKILREYKFTNVFRELDAVTLELHQRVDRFAGRESLEDRLFRIVAFRAFNVPETYDVITMEDGGFRSFAQMKIRLHKAAEAGQKVFTGAYIITNAGSKRPKIDLVVEALTEVYRQRRTLWAQIQKDGTMEGATKFLALMPMMGMFTAYEVVCDLRWQRDMILNQSPDRLTWANLGPGAKRGINRLMTGDCDGRAFNRTAEYIDYMRKILEWTPMMMTKAIFADAPTIEMREVEHSLCEFDKYMRAKRGEGRPRSRYDYSKHGGK